MDWGQFGQGFGSFFQAIGTGMKANALYNVNASNEKTARKAAEEAPKAAQWQITRLRLAKRRTLSSQRFTAARAGIQFEGTPLDVQVLTEREMELDAMQIYREGQIEKEGYLEQAKSYKEAKKNANESGAIGMLGNMVSMFG
jgi:hypothetical protein